MGNFTSRDPVLSKQMAVCKQRQKLLKKASKLRCDLADAHLKFHGLHQDVADAIKTFVEKQIPETTEYIVEKPEDDKVDDEVMENDNEDVCLKFLPALEDVEKQFRNAYEHGKHVSKKLEAETIETKQPPKLIRALSRSSSSRVHSSSTFEESEIMGSKLRELKRWEEGLYTYLMKEAMKSDKKSNANAKGEVQTKKNPDISVYQDSALFFQKKITEVKDNGVVPRLVEQLHGIKENWEAMSGFYETQKKIMSQVIVKESPLLRCDKNHQEATRALQEKLHDWRLKFASYVSLQRAYVEVLYRWLSKFAEGNNGDNVKNASWFDTLKGLESEPKAEVIEKMKGFQKDVKALLTQQKKEYDQKMKVKNLEERVKNRQGMKENGHDRETLENEIKDLENRIKDYYDKHKREMQDETQKAVDKFRTEFSKLFEKLEIFSGGAAEIYEELIKQKLLPRTPV